MRSYWKITCFLAFSTGAQPVLAGECIEFNQWNARADAIAESLWISEGSDPRYFTYAADENDPFLFISIVRVPQGRYKFTADLFVKDAPTPVVFTLDNAKTRDGSTVEIAVSSGLSASVVAEGLEPEGDGTVTLRARAAPTFRAEISAAVGKARLCPSE
ncbi:hypothetical protein [Agrobacterium pusense]|jgi:hypothetical protein|uniref:hypothetical protein n=1 Tax=Agrobacterium pusense TaxID=648995 RepID=UPI000DD95A4D|nr:hypothetical protein [Agrobacterium pusense]MCZ7929175.1 hypothetical protein [Agrobacterium pusense]